jgi:protein tyrosine phosphatase (PTP) superfamily phosphohydrolase (DUF442 family)
MMPTARRYLPIVIALLITSGCRRASSDSEPQRQATEPSPMAQPGLPHAFRVSDRVCSGGSPEAEIGFAELERLGVKTIISVDGARPDVDTATRHGIRYIHLPVGYDGIARERVLELAKAAATCEGPIYVHCHHGKHRGPAAVAAIMMCLDPNWDANRAEAWLAMAGTDPRYSGLWKLPRLLILPTPGEIERTPAEFPSVASVGDLARLMVNVDATFDRLKLAKGAGWTTPKGHADIDPAHEALILLEHYREAARLDAARKRGSEFIALLNHAEAAAVDLERSLRDRNQERAATAFERSSTMCAACHERFRDRPASR